MRGESYWNKLVHKCVVESPSWKTSLKSGLKKSFPEVFPLNSCWQWWWPFIWYSSNLKSGLNLNPTNPPLWIPDLHLVRTLCLKGSFNISLSTVGRIFEKSLLHVNFFPNSCQSPLSNPEIWFGGTFFNFGSRPPIRGFDILLPPSSQAIQNNFSPFYHRSNQMLPSVMPLFHCGS